MPARHDAHLAYDRAMLAARRFWHVIGVVLGTLFVAQLIARLAFGLDRLPAVALAITGLLALLAGLAGAGDIRAPDARERRDVLVGWGIALPLPLVGGALYLPLPWSVLLAVSIVALQVTWVQHVRRGASASRQRPPA